MNTGKYQSESLSSTMTVCNASQNQNIGFFLNGFPGLNEMQHWLLIPFFIMFLVASAGNILVLLVIVKEHHLHEPMYYFISILSSVDLVTDIILLPQALVVLWFGSYPVHLDACLVQMFCICFAIIMESSVLVLMAYDRYIAVCKPLRYASIVTNEFVFKGTLLAAVRSICAVLPIPILARTLPYYTTTIVYNVYCEYLAVINVACAHNVMSNSYFFILLVLGGLPDAALVGLSYYMIITTALKLKSREAQRKLLSTCSSHALVIATFCLLGMLSFILLFVEDKMPAYIRVLFSFLFISLPPALNPLIYGIKTKEIWSAIIKTFNKFVKYL
ncbi:olfactory receptor 52J3-like [Protopterus annectens]|uniref:olfactory receptor 52J3-like n=1 Tax=Protopterus annectens TaxID=7888 RepID=UPI001CFA909A|nr:olfactory receptor 52J3-like [Protopterus annectens]